MKKPEEYRKVATIRALQYLPGENDAQIAVFIGDKNYKGKREDGSIFLKTLESDGETQLVSPYDFVAKNPRGEVYPIKPDIFKETYALV